MQGGACIVNKENKILCTGYNGMPKGAENQLRELFQRNPFDNKHLYVCHAELNAIMDTDGADLRGCSIYVTLFPCNECAKIIIQAGITEVVYNSDKYKDRVETKASKRMFDLADVTYRPYPPTADGEC